MRLGFDRREIRLPSRWLVAVVQLLTGLGTEEAIPDKVGVEVHLSKQVSSLGVLFVFGP